MREWHASPCDMWHSFSRIYKYETENVMLRHLAAKLHNVCVKLIKGWGSNIQLLAYAWSTVKCCALLFLFFFLKKGNINNKFTTVTNKIQTVNCLDCKDFNIWFGAVDEMVSAEARSKINRCCWMIPFSLWMATNSIRWTSGQQYDIVRLHQSLCVHAPKHTEGLLANYIFPAAEHLFHFYDCWRLLHTISVQIWLERKWKLHAGNHRLTMEITWKWH